MIEKNAGFFELQTIARVHSDFGSKFGIPRQSGLVRDLTADVLFEPSFRNPEAVRELEGFSHIWLIWVFDRSAQKGWSPTVRPPRLGGNRRIGVFASRSPFRPNPIGLSAVELEGIEQTPSYGPVLHIRGADLADGTPVLDIKPYLPYSDSYPDAAAGFAGTAPEECLRVEIPASLQECLSPGRLEALRHVLALDPRPPYQDNPDRIYGFTFAGMEVRFSVSGNLLTVQGLHPYQGALPPGPPPTFS